MSEQKRSFEVTLREVSAWLSTPGAQKKLKAALAAADIATQKCEADRKVRQADLHEPMTL